LGAKLVSLLRIIGRLYLERQVTLSPHVITVCYCVSHMIISKGRASVLPQSQVALSATPYAPPQNPLAKPNPSLVPSLSCLYSPCPCTKTRRS
jgi:hypothetical protein